MWYAKENTKIKRLTEYLVELSNVFTEFVIVFKYNS
jgi:hypothetical protein